jgi:hypothetical protein
MRDGTNGDEATVYQRSTKHVEWHIHTAVHGAVQTHTGVDSYCAKHILQWRSSVALLNRVSGTSLGPGDRA